MKTEANDCAFTMTRDIDAGSATGLTKREYFAACAMQGYCANEQAARTDDRALAGWSVATADALLAALNEVKP